MSLNRKATNMNLLLGEVPPTKQSTPSSIRNTFFFFTELLGVTARASRLDKETAVSNGARREGHGVRECGNAGMRESEKRAKLLPQCGECAELECPSKWPNVFLSLIDEKERASQKQKGKITEVYAIASGSLLLLPPITAPSVLRTEYRYELPYKVG